MRNTLQKRNFLFVDTVTRQLVSSGTLEFPANKIRAVHEETHFPLPRIRGLLIQRSWKASCRARNASINTYGHAHVYALIRSSRYSAKSENPMPMDGFPFPRQVKKGRRGYGKTLTDKGETGVDGKQARAWRNSRETGEELFRRCFSRVVAGLSAAT